MKGVVEVYKNFGLPDQELVYKEDNLLVDGAAETICTMLTMPSSIGKAIPKIIDASNFGIQAISFGKSSEAYKENGHFFPFHVSSYDDAFPNPAYATYVSKVKEDTRIRAVSKINENIAFTLSSYDPMRDPGVWPSPTDKKLEPNTETAIDVVSGQYHYMGSAVMQGRAHAHGHNLNRVASNTNPNLIAYTDGPTTDPNLETSSFWAKGGLTANCLLTLQDRHTGPFYGTSSFLVSAGTPTTKKTAVLRHSFPSGTAYFHQNVDHTLSMYVKLPKVNPVSAISVNIKDIESPLEPHIGYFRFYDTDKEEYIAPSGSSPLVSTNGVSTAVFPASGADGSAGWYRLETRLPNLGSHADTKNGDYMQVIVVHDRKTPSKQTGALEHWGWQLEESFGASPFQRVKGIFPTFEEGGIAGDIFLGCYPNPSGTKYAIVSSLTVDDLNLATNVIVSGQYPTYLTNPHFNASTVRSMDRDGYVKAYYPFKAHGDLNDGTSNPLSGLIVSAAPNFSSVGEVSCICTIASADLGLANMYGGIFKAGLWTIDLEKTLSDIDPHGFKRPTPTFPLKFTAGYNRLVYKLFAEKNFTKNIAAIKDHIAGGGQQNAGARSYGDLTLIWKLRFLL